MRAIFWMSLLRYRRSTVIDHTTKGDVWREWRLVWRGECGSAASRHAQGAALFCCVHHAQLYGILQDSKLDTTFRHVVARRSHASVAMCLVVRHVFVSYSHEDERTPTLWHSMAFSPRVNLQNLLVKHNITRCVALRSSRSAGAFQPTHNRGTYVGDMILCPCADNGVSDS